MSLSVTLACVGLTLAANAVAVVLGLDTYPALLTSVPGVVVMIVLGIRARRRNRWAAGVPITGAASCSRSAV